MSHPYGMLSLLPPVVAILLAIATRKAIFALLAGLLCGSLITRRGDPIGAIYDLLEVHLWPTLIDPGKLRVFCFTLLMGGLVGLVIRCGGMRGLVASISPLARSRRGGQLTTWAMGLLVFFDDYANTLLLGNTMRPVCDRLRISREKLAYVVDSTAAPVAGLALLSTWVAVELDYIREGLATIGNPTGFSAVELFVASIPYRFYVLGSLLMVPLVAFLGRDFGPMLAAERRRLEGDSDSSPAEPTAAARSGSPAGPLISHWSNAGIPILVTLGVVMWLLYLTGLSALGDQLSSDDGGGERPPLREIIGAADSSVALQYGSLVGLLVGIVLCRFHKLLSYGEMVDAIGRGAALVLPAIAILWFASALSRMTSDQPVAGRTSVGIVETTAVSSQDHSPRNGNSDPAQQANESDFFPFQDHRLYTGDYLKRLVVGEDESSSRDVGTTLRLLPTVTFMLAGVVAFCTGTSFGTMGMLIPLVVTLSHSLLSQQGIGMTADHPLLLASLGGVLAGAVFGDHCSPISDTTVLSSQACGCDHIAHVITQLPYAVAVASVAILLGTLPVGWGVSPTVLLPLQALTLWLIVRYVGQPVSHPAISGKEDFQAIRSTDEH